PVVAARGDPRARGTQAPGPPFPGGTPTPPIAEITLKPLAESGFNANRATPNNFCNTVPPAQSSIFCPRPDLPANDPANTNNPQAVFPNQLLSALIRGERLYLPNIGAQPEPPEIFNANVQALVYAVDTRRLVE